jgi:hypothetical protein
MAGGVLKNQDLKIRILVSVASTLISALCCVRYQKLLWAKLKVSSLRLKTLHKKLQTDGDRIQRDIAEYVELSQQVMH